jgi:hypothetical protein
MVTQHIQYLKPVRISDRAFNELNKRKKHPRQALWEVLDVILNIHQEVKPG